ncbi:MAG: Chemotaxis protein CheY [Elusimicrobia bacterium ADurb.Bin231]|nr:MAG: Chemotaxis protein CheY [Elusimicrobia bacterium ADurb.Bin231]
MDEKINDVFYKGSTMLGLFKTKRKTATILVVDDEPDLVSTIKARLEWNKFKVETASNGSLALEKLESFVPDLILLDGNMPVMSGFQMLEIMRQDNRFKSIPVIMLTAVCESNNIALAGSLGVTEYVTKPFEYPLLLEKITSIVDKE